MPSHRTTDAAQIAPYLTHIVSHHGQVTLVPADNNGRVRQAPTKGSRSRQRQDRNPRTEEEIRFNVGPRTLRTLVGNRGRRGGRHDRGRGEHDEAYPNYPPPSFLEATSVPVTPGNATPATLSPPASPISPGGPAPSLPTTSPESQPTPTRSRNNADSDTSSLEIIDMDSLPVEEQLPSGSRLEDNIKRDWINRRGIEFPSPPDGQTRGRSKRSGRAILDSDSEDASEENKIVPPPSSSRAKNSSLSPLRTLFPYRLMAVDQPFSASPNPSPYSSRSSLPFLSATSLKMSMSTTSISSVKGEGFFSRKFLSSKGKERARESLDAWEVVDSESSQVSDNSSSPTRSQSFTYGMPVNPVKEQTSSPPTSSATTAPHPLSLRDRKPPPVPFVTRPRRRAPPPPPKPAELLSVPQGPILTSVRTRKPPPAEKPAHLVSSPLGHDSWRPSSLDVDTESSSLQRAMVTPLPVSPIDNHPEIVPFTPATPVSPNPSEIVSVSVCEATPTSPTVPAFDNLIFARGGDVLARSTSPNFPPMPGEYPDSDEPPVSPISLRTGTHSSPTGSLSILPDPSTSSRRHYPGRPLPQPPGTTRPLFDSVSAINDELPMNSATPHCPEGLLIDFGDPPCRADNTGSHSLAPYIDGYQNNLTTSSSYATSSSSSVDLLGSIADFPSPVTAQSALPNGTEGATVLSNQLASSTPYSGFTDLDVLLSRIDDEDRRDGSNYDGLIMLSEFIGPASPPRGVNQPISNPPGTPPHPVQPNLALPTSQGHIPSANNLPMLDIVRVERRRMTKDGRVKLKLGLFDAAVDKCGICLTQFRSGEPGQLGSVCRHAFHEKCLGRWLARSKTCPMCRLTFTLDLPSL